jgi:DNA-binding IclR family transcriptional regulator
MNDAKNPRVRQPRIRQVPAVSRAISILRALGESKEPQSLRALANSLSLVPSTCLHILRVLAAEGLVKADEATKRYALGMGMLSLARSVIERSGFASLAQPCLERVAQEWNITTMGIGVQDEDHVVLLAIALSGMPFGLHTDVGNRFPALSSATGRLVGAYTPQSAIELKRRFKQVRWQRPLSFEAWKSELKSVKEKGYAVDRGRFIGGVTVLAVPVFNSAGMLTHALGGAGLSVQLDAARREKIAQSLQREAKYLSMTLLTRL